MADKTVLIVDCDHDTLHLLKKALQDSGYKVIQAETCMEGCSLFSADNPDIVILEPELPDSDGMALLSKVRFSRNTPVIIISSKSQDSSIVSALDAGADDYITKPFSVPELLARIRTAFRHCHFETPVTGIFELSDLRIDQDRRRVFVREAEVHLTPIEYKMLLLLMEHRGKVLTHSYLQEQIWGYPSTDDYQTLRVFVANIRRKLGDDPYSPRYIVTEVGVGYRFVDK